MKVWTTLQPDELRAIAHELGLKIYDDHPTYGRGGIRKDGRAWNFRLALDATQKKDGWAKYHRTSTSYFHEGRKVAAVCWHGHRDFMIEVYKRDPDARIKSAFADYRGVADFREKYPKTAYRNLGSMMNPVYAMHACACAHSGWLVDLSPVPDVQEWRMQTSNIKSCPHYIMVPEHYRADGSCKCDDPEHREFMKREWDYDDESFAGIPLREEVSA